jgi:folylpolyglutamate synthase/dihydropteroate synthase
MNEASLRVITEMPVRDFDKAFWSLITKGSYLKGELTKKSVQSIMKHYLSRLSVNLSELSVIHVAGSKGKGSTCVQTEALLRARGLTTGLFTSPHLIDVRERFRLDGMPIKQTLFLKHFWHVWDTLHVREDPNKLPQDIKSDPMYCSVPGFFRFMTCLAFYIFSVEKVDVAVIEVGIGGRLDATNVVPKPIVCGISLLDLDHVQILGNTLEEIAAEKSGIMKPNVPCYTVRQDSSAYNVLLNKSKEIGCKLETPIHLRKLDGTRVVDGSDEGGGCSNNKRIRRGDESNSSHSSHSSHSSTSTSTSTSGSSKNSNDSYSTSTATTATPLVVGRKRDRSASNTLKDEFQLGLAGLHQETNASLALSLSRCYLRSTNPNQYSNRLQSNAWLNSTEITALENCTWPGRGQTVRSNIVNSDVKKDIFSNSDDYLTLRLDGAHTKKSIESCFSWYVDVTSANHSKVLIFNCSHERNVGQLLQILHNGSAQFDGVIFCPADVARPSHQELPSVEELAAKMGVIESKNGKKMNSTSDTKLSRSSSSSSSNSSTDDENLPKWQVTMRDAWNLLVEQEEYSKVIIDGNGSSISNNNSRRKTGNQPRIRNKLVGGWAHACNSIDSAMNLLKKKNNINIDVEQYEVLVTGSLYLVGGVLSRCGWNPDVGF